MFVAITVLIGACLAVLSSPWAQRYLERRVITALEAATGARVEVREFRFRPMILQFVLHGVVLHGKEPATARPLFAAKTVVIRLSPRAIMARHVLLRSLDWDEAEIHLYANPDGSTNLPETAMSAEVGGGVGRLTLSRTTFFWNDRRLRFDLRATEVAILLRRISPGRYSGSLSTTSIDLRTPSAGLPPLRVSTHFEFSGTGLETQILAWQVAGIDGSAQLKLSDWHSPQLRFSYQTGGDVKDLAASLKFPALQGGRVESQGTLTYLDQKWEAKGQLQTRQMQVQTGRGRLTGASMATDYSADSRRVVFPNIAGTALGGKFRGSGEISLRETTPEFLFRVRADALAAHSILETLMGPGRPPNIASRASGTVRASWKGSFRDFRSQFNVDFKPQETDRPGVVPVGGLLRGSARMEPELLFEFEQADLRTGGSVISAHGTVGARDVDLAFQASMADFEEWRPIVEQSRKGEKPIPLILHSKVSFGGSISGPIRSPETRGHLASGSFEYEGTRWDSLQAEVTLTPQLIQVASARLEHKGSTLDLDASVALQAWQVDTEGPLRLAVCAEKTPLQGLIRAAGIDAPVAGSFSGQLELRGSLANTSGQGHLQVKNGTVAGEPFDALSAQIRVDRSVWQFKNIRWTKGQGVAHGEGEFRSTTREYRCTMTGGGFQLAEFQRVQASLKSDSPSSLQGLLSFDIQAHGRRDDVTVEATGTIQDIIAKGISFGSLNIHVRGEGRDLTLAGNAEGPGGTVKFFGAGQSTAEWPLEVKGEYSSFRLDPLIQLFSPRESAPQLVVSGTLQASIPLKNLDGLEIWMQAPELAITYPNLAWKSASPVGVHYARQRLEVSRFRLQGPATDLEVGGSIEFARQGALAFNAEGRAEATLLNLLDPALRANGESVVKVRIAGTLKQPTLHGTVAIQDVNVGYGDLPFRITGLSGDVTLEGERATLRSLRGGSGGGTVALNGFVTFGAVPRFNIETTLSQVRLRYPSDFTSLLDGTLRLVGGAERGQITGEVIVRQIFPPENFNWLERVARMEGSTDLGGPTTDSPVAPKIHLNIHIQSAPAVRFETRTPELRLVADIDMRLQGTLARPVEVGTIQILSGEAVFRENRYTIRRGDISMTNPFRTERTLGLEAQTRIQPYNLIVNVSGPFDRLKITYRSDPPLPSEDIVTLLALGYARQQETMATGSTHPVAAVGATALLSEALSTQVSGRIKRLFGVSRIKIDPNVGGVGTTGGARITVEQRVTRDLTLTYVTNTSTSQYRIIQLEWAVTDNISVIGARDQNGIFGTELRFRQRFK